MLVQYFPAQVMRQVGIDEAFWALTTDAERAIAAKERNFILRCGDAKRLFVDFVRPVWEGNAVGFEEERKDKIYREGKAVLRNQKHVDAPEIKLYSEADGGCARRGCSFEINSWRDWPRFIFGNENF
jgi:hypothetical protein